MAMWRLLGGKRRSNRERVRLGGRTTWRRKLVEVLGKRWLYSSGSRHWLG